MSASHQIIERLSRLLHDEISAIAIGELEVVRKLYSEKPALLNELEEASGQIEAHLKKGGDQSARLREDLTNLYALIRKDQLLLERMADATGRAAQEISKIRDRYGLGGLYESSGSLRKDDVARPQHIDQSI